ncbi:hypothetical protein C1H57_23485 [Clostridium sp. 2-1]|uniref:hypothetical protein n=2 Tax=Clostridium TaxID=1485 RepID=UPI000CDB5268|nr:MULTISPECIES: hypothetical protein [Clostridium]MBN7572807.1 hypothetical protein [Clostridium beijerinckii]MBN7578147.1 hypothetical protein [Clostridium beijerinckii]MBN7582581.1 hypothetical protein [Clostridium beijerinckii]MBO0521821.1 hypothetical protein [Clostridium beijerinckii]POO88901.1 hypothetical protein C1H57_23485 [Clostridium sp. 2-1]
MKSECYIEGQISIFDLPAIEVIEPKKIIIKEETKGVDKFYAITRLYSQSCSRIVKILSGALLVELDDKTLYFNASGINEFCLPKDVGIMPGEEILIVNSDKKINETQKQKLEDLKPKKYIKRKGDANLIIPGEKTIVINPKGWILEYIQKPKFKENEIFETENHSINKVIEENIRESDIDYKVGNKVYIEYHGIKSIGKIVRIYNNGETLNVVWHGKGKQTAFYYKNVELVE